MVGGNLSLGPWNGQHRGDLEALDGLTATLEPCGRPARTLLSLRVLDSRQIEPCVEQVRVWEGS